MLPLSPPPWQSRALRWLPFLISALLVATALHFARRAPWLLAGILILIALFSFERLRARRRVRDLLISGDIEAMMSAWHDALERVPHRETVAPLVEATALAANGMVQRARHALARAARGQAWEAALEHRLFVETLLDAFEGEPQQALAKAELLAHLPLPPVRPKLRERVTLLRAATGALARAFAHTERVDDGHVLEAAARHNPLVHWAMRYAAAVAYVDQGRLLDAGRQIDGAPSWPSDSAFHAFHNELTTHVRAAPIHSER